MIIEFPNGHPYDFERLRIGLNVLLGRDAVYKDELCSLWEWSAGSQSVPISVPPNAVIKQVFTSVMSAVAFSAVGNFNSASWQTNIQIELKRSTNYVSVQLFGGYADPLCEVVGFWRYGAPGVRDGFKLD